MRIYIKPLISVVDLGIENLLDNVPITNSQGSSSTGQPGGQYAKGDFGFDDDSDNGDDDQNYDDNPWGN
jgi:hypothetical protein